VEFHPRNSGPEILENLSSNLDHEFVESDVPPCSENVITTDVNI
jgi:hypothetical protein